MKQSQSNLDIYKRLGHYILPYWHFLAVALLGTMAYAGIDALFTYLLKPLLDKGFIARDQSFIHWIPAMVLGIFLLRGLTSFCSSYLMTMVARNVVMVLRQQLFSHLLKLPSSFFDNATSGQLLSKILYDVKQIEQVSSNALPQLLQSGFLVIGLLIVMFVNSWQLSLIYLMTAPIIAFIVNYANKRTRRLTREVQTAMGSVTEIAEESIEGYRVVRTFGGEAYETNKFNRATNASRQRDLKVAATKAFTVSGVQFIAACGISFIMFLAISPESASVLSAGAFVSIIGAMLALLKPMKNLTNINTIIQMGLVGAQSVFAVLDEPTEKNTGSKTLPKLSGAIQFSNVNFTYPHTERQVLSNINLDVQPGQIIALVGRSGGGKSTFVSLLPRFYDVTNGSIQIDNININEFDLKFLRSQIALVTQHVTLFNDTVANNIAYGSFDAASQEQIDSAARDAQAYDFIKALPKGFDSIVGENGVLLSGGQRQRLAIARAILKDSPILILDEATSALDTESERAIQKALEAVMKNRTTFVIAHRLSTIEHADKIIVMDEGRVLEAGTHQALLAQQGQYARLYEMQFSDQLSVAV